MAAASLKCTFWSRAVVFNTSIISWVSLLAEPSQARLTVSPSFTILSTGATPEARIMLDGVFVMEHKRMTMIDEEKVLYATQKAAEKLINEVGLGNTQWGRKIGNLGL